MTLKAQELACRRGERLLFEGLSFTLSRGDVLMIEGANGAGKSSLLRVLAGLLSPARGSVLWAEDNPSSPETEEPRLADRMFFIGHDNGIKPAFTAMENLRFWTAFLGGTPADESALDAAFKFWGLSGVEGLPAGWLSAGQRRRLALARLQTIGVARRPLWLLDEPTAALDRPSKALFAKAVERHREAGGIAVMASHEDPGIEGIKILTLGRRAAA